MPTLALSETAAASDSQTAVIAALTALTVAFISVLAQVFLWFAERRARRRQDLLQHRRQALLAALEVVDNVFANSAFGGNAPPNPYEWQLRVAREAMNGMIVFCANPQRTVEAFAKAIGLHNPNTSEPPQYGPVDLEAFRRVVCEELELKAPNFTRDDMSWIASLPGGT